jgi:GNAT superfamily N-acetyltransferase
MSRTIDELIVSLIRLKHPNYPQKMEQSKSLAPDFGIKEAAFSNYKNGKRKPADDQAEAMAAAWTSKLFEELDSKRVGNEELRRRLQQGGFPLKSLQRESLKKELSTQLKESVAQVTQASLLHSLVDFKTDLKVSYLSYGVFSGSVSSFFNSIFQRYVKQLGIQPDAEIRDKFNVDHQLRNREIHLALCYFASVNRTLSAKFFTTPLRISLGAVCLSKYRGSVGPLAAAVSTEGARARQPIRPIVIRGEVGYLHCVNTLGFRDEPDSMTVRENLSLDELVGILGDHSKDAGEKGPTPVVIVDEYNALRLLKASVAELTLITPTTTNRTNQVSTYRRELPQYYMGIACNREDTEFMNFLDESLNHFLSAEVETTARALSKLFWALEKEVLEVGRLLGNWSGNDYTGRPLTIREQRIVARQYSLYALSLDKLTASNLDSLPRQWHRILKRSREIVLRELVTEDEHRKNTQSFIRSVLADHGGQQTEQLWRPIQVEDLVQYTDKDLEMNSLRGLFEGELFTLIEAYLTGSEKPEERITLDHFTPADCPKTAWANRTDDAVNGILELLNQLGQMYGKMLDTGLKKEGGMGHGPAIAEKIGAVLEDRCMRYGHIILAKVSTKSAIGFESTRYAGLICILEQPGCRTGDNPVELQAERELLEKSCELRYLWVAQAYRRRNIARLLLGEALRWCRTQEYAYARVAILPQLDEAISRMSELHFIPIKPLTWDTKFAEDRFIFEKTLNPSAD